MGRYYIQENRLATNGPTIVKDESGKQRYLMMGKWGAKGDVLQLLDLQNNLIAHVKQEKNTVKAVSNFSIYFQNKKVGTLHHIFSLQRDYYLVSKLSWLVVGNIPQHHYSIHFFNQTIMTMSKTYLAQGSFYELAIENDDVAPLCLCIAPLLDYWQLNRNKETTPLLAKNKLGWAYKIKSFKE